MKTILTLTALAGLAAGYVMAADTKAGKEAYDKSCKTCHGSDGAPNASVAKVMKVEMKDLKSPDVQKMSADEMKKVITEGKGKMKAVKTVTNVDDVVAYVKTLK